MQLCLKLLTNPKLVASNSTVFKILAEMGKKIYKQFLNSNQKQEDEHELRRQKEQEQLLITQPDE